MDIKAAEMVIFDFDGVIVDTEPLHFRAFQEILAPSGLDFSWEDYVKTYMGFDDRDAFREAYRVKGLDLENCTLMELIARKAAVFHGIVANGVTPYPGVIGLVRELHSSGMPLAISSGALKSDIEPILKALDLAHCFKVVVTADDVEKSKPDPSSYIMAFENLAELFPGRTTSLSATIAIEDTPAGISAAKGAGLAVVAVTNSYKAEMLGQADLVVDSLEFFLSEK